MAIVQPGIPNGGFVNPTPVTPPARVANPGLPNGGFTTPLPVTPRVSVSNTVPTQGPGMLTSNNTLAAQYGNSPLAKWLQVGNQAPGTWAAGMSYNGSPITQEEADQLNRVSGEPNNPTWFNQNAMTQAMSNGNLVPQIQMHNLNNAISGGTGTNSNGVTGPNQYTPGNPTTPTNNNANLYGAGYTGYGNINLASGNGATSTTATPGTIGGVTSAGTGAVDPNAGPSPAITQTPNTTTSAVPRARIANPAVGMPGAVGGLPNNANVNTNRTTMPVTPAPQVSGNYNMAIRQNHNMNNF